MAWNSMCRQYDNSIVPANTEMLQINSLFK